MLRMNETRLGVHTFISQVILVIGPHTKMEGSCQPNLLMKEQLRTFILTRTASSIWRGCSSLARSAELSSMRVLQYAHFVFHVSLFFSLQGCQ